MSVEIHQISSTSAPTLLTLEFPSPQIVREADFRLKKKHLNQVFHPWENMNKKKVNERLRLSLES
jgi:hypothetical protein